MNDAEVRFILVIFKKSISASMIKFYSVENSKMNLMSYMEIRDSTSNQNFKQNIFNFICFFVFFFNLFAKYVLYYFKSFS